ncbi:MULTISPECIES: CYTH and CHAD domain-containing protein [unclassified Kitasatospora]|uniref:CYTH and CHAD domain-containing protein n=1 Tax=unclassified Kitasatospora TaxID=2633591 RepID=UPI0033FD5605
MGTQQVETERKYDGAALPQQLDQVPGIAAAQSTEPQSLDAVYYDTPDLRLLRRHITLRRRTGGNDAGWHLKLPRADDVREEVRLPVETGGPDDVPTELSQLVAAFTRGSALAPVAHLRTHRSRLLLRNDRGDTLAQITEDRVAAQVLHADHTAPAPSGARPAVPGPGVEGRPRADTDGAGPSGGTSTEVCGWTEFEVELENGTPALLDRIEAVFVHAGLVRSPWPSKLSRALGGPRVSEARPAGSAPAPAPGSAGALVMDGFRAQLDALLTLDAAVRRGEADSVHRMRVTARRLRSLLKAHRRLFKRDRAEPLATELRWLGRLLGQARDQEVLGELLVDQLDAVPARLRRGALRGRLTERYAKGYHSAWQQAVAELDGTRYFALLERLDAFACDPPLRRRADRNARRYASGALRREQRRTLKRLDRALHTAPGPPRDQALHRARKAAKRARYTADGAQPHVPRRTAKRVAKFATRMKKLHKVLGTHQDSVVARHELIALESQDTGSEQHAFAYGVLYERQRHTADAAQQRLPKLRRRAGRRKLTT